MIIEAHRGAKIEAPENTMASFKRAIELGADSIELDTHPCADGELVVIHDSTVDRTTNGSGEVSAMTLAELQALDASAKFELGGFSNEPVPTLGQVMELMSTTSMRLNIEIKQAPEGLDVLNRLLELLDQFDKRDHYIVSSFNCDLLMELHKMAPDLSLAPIGKAEVIIPLAIQHGLPWVHCQKDSLTEELLRQALASDVKVGVWTVNDHEVARRWVDLGVENIISDDPRLMLGMLR